MPVAGLRSARSDDDPVGPGRRDQLVELRRDLVPRPVGLPLGARGALVADNHSACAKQIADWKTWVRQQWPYTQISAQANLPATARPGERVAVTAQVNPAGIDPAQLRVEAVLMRGEQQTRVPLRQQEGSTFSAEVPLEGSGLYSVGVRMLPLIEGLSNDLEAGLIKWA